MSSRSSLSRRRFLQTSAAASTLFAAPYFIPARAFGANERVNLGFIGCKNRGMQNMEGFGIVGKDVGTFATNCAAVCDVDTGVIADAVKQVEKTGHKPSTFGDYRKMLERKDIDAVTIGTPDHWHAMMTVHACQAGKHIYSEKPVARSAGDGRKLLQAIRERGLKSGAVEDKLYLPGLVKLSRLAASDFFGRIVGFGNRVIVFARHV